MVVPGRLGISDNIPCYEKIGAEVLLLDNVQFLLYPVVCLSVVGRCRVAFLAAVAGEFFQ